jgi:hypothetical protein
VQWNASYDPRDRRQWVSVNLEGLEYEGWPVSRLIRRELASPRLLAVAEEKTVGLDIEVRWRRDYWQVQARPPIVEASISPTPISIGDLTDSKWRQALEEAQECLDASRGRQGRATQRVTLAVSGEEVKGPVSPHLTLTVYASSFRSWPDILEKAKGRLQPYYAWAVEQAR